MCVMPPACARLWYAAAGLAVAGMTSTAMSLLYRLDATMMNLIFNLGTAALIVIMEAIVGRRCAH